MAPEALVRGRMRLDRATNFCSMAFLLCILSMTAVRAWAVVQLWLDGLPLPWRITADMFAPLLGAFMLAVGLSGLRSLVRWFMRRPVTH